MQTHFVSWSLKTSLRHGQSQIQRSLSQVASDIFRISSVTQVGVVHSNPHLCVSHPLSLSLPPSLFLYRPLSLFLCLSLSMYGMCVLIWSIVSFGQIFCDLLGTVPAQGGMLLPFGPGCVSRPEAIWVLCLQPDCVVGESAWCCTEQ